LAGLALTIVAVFSPWTGLLVASSVAILLPFGVLPVRLGLTPTFLELVLLGLLVGWLVPPLVRGDRRWRLSWIDAPMWCFAALTLFSLMLGWGRGVDGTVLHNYAKMLLGLLAYFGVRQIVSHREQVRRFLAVFLLAAGLASLLGLFLYALPDDAAMSLLTRLSVLGYPTEGRVLRFVEDDPAGLERAIGTSVDPNSFGGMLALAGAVALAEVLAGFRGGGRTRRSPGQAEPTQPALPRPVLLAILALLLPCLYLTYSRAALGGFVVAVLFLATVRYRRLWWGILAGVVLLAVLVVGLGWGGAAVERFRQGILFQDLANQMRLDEFNNAVTIVRRYPVFGIGFGFAPDVDLGVGVSSLYLTIAERMGLVGLVAFLACVSTAVVVAFKKLRTPATMGGTLHEEDSGHRLALLAGLVAVLAVSLLDHYFFNLEFPHMTALLWIILAIVTESWGQQRLPGEGNGQGSIAGADRTCTGDSSSLMERE
jgi:O-antigen ligase